VRGASSIAEITSYSKLWGTEIGADRKACHFDMLQGL